MSQVIRFAALLLSGSVLSMNAIFLHRYFNDLHRLRRLTPLASGGHWEVALYHAGVTLIVLSIAISQVFALSLGGFRLNPGIVLALTGLLILDVAMWRTAVRLGPNSPDDEDGPGGSLEPRDKGG